jgi:hypothetical protein
MVTYSPTVDGDTQQELVFRALADRSLRRTDNTSSGQLEPYVRTI